MIFGNVVKSLANKKDADPPYARKQMPLPNNSKALPSVPIPFPSSQNPHKPVGCSTNEPIQTNNFYNNLAVEGQDFPVWTLPYSLWLAKDANLDFGMAFNHTDAAQQVFGPPNADPPTFYFNPPKIKSLVLTGPGFDSARIELKNHGKMSVTASVVGSAGKITMPLVQGMGFITAIYERIAPVVASQVGVQHFERVKSLGEYTKYKVLLFNQVVWLIYSNDPDLKLVNPNRIAGGKVGAVVQICRGDAGVYDKSAGIWPTSCTVHYDGNHYSLLYKTNKPGKSIIWCLPHHQEVLTPETEKTYTKLKLDSPTKGVMKAYATNELVMKEEKLPRDINWEYPTAEYSKLVLDAIRSAASEDVKADVVAMANIDSMYFSGKVIDKYAYVAYVCHFILKDKKLTDVILPKVKKAIDIFASNAQKNPLNYDTSWKGVRSVAIPSADFGNSVYNDHHFHYGYHVHAIALVAKIDGNWLKSNNGKVFNFVTTLVKDYANPVADDKFPQFRSFDWYHGHSWAHGIVPAGDGKDEESSSEDYHAVYALKLYAQIIGDKNYEECANLMLAIMRRAINMYMLFSDDNRIQPKRITRNKVSGILFENKIDYATYFGRGDISNEFIHGIHMLPLTPISSYMRHRKFVREEWDQKIAPIIDRIPGGWKGVLMLNLAIIDPKRSWKWFSGHDWKPQFMDDGMSRTWSLAYIANVANNNGGL